MERSLNATRQGVSVLPSPSPFSPSLPSLPIAPPSPHCLLPLPPHKGLHTHNLSSGILLVPFRLALAALQATVSLRGVNGQSTLIGLRKLLVLFGLGVPLQACSPSNPRERAL